MLDALARLVRRHGLADPSEMPDPDEAPFQGGMIGFFGYDLAPLLERLPRRSPRETRLPDVRFALYDTAVTVDHASGAVELRAHDLLGEGTAAVERRCRDWRRALRHDPPPVRPSRLGPLESNFEPEEYREAVGRALEYIRAGDIFQVNLSQRFSARGRPEPLDLYLRLKAVSPSPFAAFLRWDDLAVVSASPEWFYQTRGDRLVTRPIKGTRPRGASAEEDARLATGLAASPKDRAELTMIVDLERNDLGRVCRYGTVRVIDPLTVETFAQVHHLVATVEGRLRPGCGPIDVVRALFPGRVDHRGAEDPRDGDHRRAGAVATQPVHRGRSATSAAAAPAASTSRSGRCSSRGTASATRSAAGSWPTRTPRPSIARPSTRAAASAT